MKKVFTFLAAAGALLMSSCDNGNGTDNGDGNGNGGGPASIITLEEGTQSDRTIPADATEVSVKFNSTGNWGANIGVPPATRMNIPTPLPAVGWATLDGASDDNKVVKTGTAGDHTLTVKLEPNTTKEARAVMLRIIGSSESTASLRIVQSAAAPVKQVKSISETETTESDPAPDFKEVTEFTYDNAGRLVLARIYNPDFEHETDNGTTYTLNYESGKVVLKCDKLSGDYTATLGADGYATLISQGGSTYKDVKVTYESGQMRQSKREDIGSTYNYEWSGGNMVQARYSEGNEYVENFKYTAHANAGASIDLNVFLNGLTLPDVDEDASWILCCAGALGKRSSNLTETYYVYLSQYTPGPGEESYPQYELSDVKPLAYEFTADGYPSSVTAKYTISEYKVYTDGTTERELVGTKNYTDLYEITYNE